MRWSDIDRLGHVNNAIYLTYLEQARIQYIQEACQWPWHTHGLVLARVEIDYRVPIVETDSPTAYIRCSRLGKKSFNAINLIAGPQQGGTEPVVFAVAHTVLVVVNPNGQGTLPIPEAQRQGFITYEKVPPA